MRSAGLGLLLMACASEQPAAAPAAPAKASPRETAPAPPPTPAPEPVTDAGVGAPASPAPAPPEGPKADNPGYSDVSSLAGPHLPDGHYFVDGKVGAPLPCKPCPKPPACKPGGKCPPYPACADCAPSLILEHAGATITISLAGATAPELRAGEQLRVVLEKRAGDLYFGKRMKPCPPSRCLETEPPIELEPAGKGRSVRRDGERCYAKRGCPPNAKCDIDAESRVRCP